jgi:hypothetical protein
VPRHSSDNSQSKWSVCLTGLQQHIVNAPWKLVFLFDLFKLRFAKKTKNKMAVVSFYMSNISKDVVAAQAEIISRFLPVGVDVIQLHTGFGHANSIDLFLCFSRYEIIILLDIDCIPISIDAFPTLIAQARAGFLVGAAQRAHHIDNECHIYVGPFLMGLNMAAYRQLGRPRFSETRRGDVAEELTYRAEAHQCEIKFLWPTSCEAPLWHLTDDAYFGRNTIYENSFLHAFQIRQPEHQAAFLATIGRVLADKAASA